MRLSFIYDCVFLFFFCFFEDYNFVGIMYVFVFVWFWWMVIVDFCSYLIDLLFVDFFDYDFGLCWGFSFDVFWYLVYYWV